MSQTLVQIDSLIILFLIIIALIIGLAIPGSFLIMSAEARTFIKAKMFKAAVVQVYDPLGFAEFKIIQPLGKEGQYKVIGGTGIEDTEIYIRPRFNDPSMNTNYTIRGLGTTLFHALGGKTVMVSPSVTMAIHAVEKKGNLTPEMELFAKQRHITIIRETTHTTTAPLVPGDSSQGDTSSSSTSLKTETHNIFTMDVGTLREYFYQYNDSIESNLLMMKERQQGFTEGAQLRDDLAGKSSGKPRWIMFAFIGAAAIAVIGGIYLVMQMLVG